MSRLLSLSRAARLVGVRRGALQSRIRSGDLVAFEGMVAVEDLLRLYPQANLDGQAGLEQFEAIKDEAYRRRMRDRLMPSTEALVARVVELGRERAEAQAQIEHYRALVSALQAKLHEAGAGELLRWLGQHVEPGARGGAALLAQESFLRIMTAHVQVQPGGREFFVEGSDSLLEAALRAGLSLDYGCSAGGCGKCKARVVSGQVHRTRHTDFVLSAEEKDSGVVLMCCTTALTDLVIEARAAHGAADMPLQTIDAKVKAVSPLGEDMRLLHLQTPRTNRLRFLAGQSVNLSLGEGIVASFPVASCPCDDRNLQFHVRWREGDAFTARVFDGLKATDTVRVEGPRGEFVLDEASLRPLAFVACETGFAPVKSLIEHAMALDVSETLDVVWIAAGAGGRYLDNLCRAWADALDGFRYEPVVAGTRVPDEAALEAAIARIIGQHPDLDACDLYLAGPAAWTGVLAQRLLARGLPRAQLRVCEVEA